VSTAYDIGTDWLRCAEERPFAARRLVCLPHAGGSAHMYRDWCAGLPGTEVLAVQYPGRADRIAEPLAEELHRLADEIAAALAPLTDLPLAVFGHSMGAVVGYEVARRLEAAGSPPEHLFVSGMGAPHDPDRPGRDAVEPDDDALVAALVGLGGTEAGAMADPVLRELVLPYVRSDFTMLQRYRYRPGPRLDCPVTAVTADDDPHVTAASADRWAELTRGGFIRHAVPGDHFYLTSRPPLALIRKELL
jgi:surfactin synthase thioesterase subunit